MFLSLPSYSKPPTFLALQAHFLHFQSRQYHFSLTVLLSSYYPPTSAGKGSPLLRDSCDQIGPLWLTQNNLPIWKFIPLIISAKFSLPWKVIYSQVQGWGHGNLWEPLFCSPESPLMPLDNDWQVQWLTTVSPQGGTALRGNLSPRVSWSTVHLHLSLPKSLPSLGSPAFLLWFPKSVTSFSWENFLNLLLAHKSYLEVCFWRTFPETRVRYVIRNMLDTGTRQQWLVRRLVS